MNKNNLDIVIYCTDNFLPVVTGKVIPSLKSTDIDNIHIWYHKNQPDCQPGATDNSIYQDLMIERKIEYTNYIRSKKAGSRVIFLDADIIFKSPIIDTFIACLDKCDIVFQGSAANDDRFYLCSGIVGVKCNKKVLNFMDNVFIPCIKSGELRQTGTPQAEENILIRGTALAGNDQDGYLSIELKIEDSQSKNIKIPYIKKYDMTIGTFPKLIGDGSMLYHAMNTAHSIEAKLEALN